MKVKVLSDFCHNMGTQISLDKHCKKYPTLWPHVHLCTPGPNKVKEVVFPLMEKLFTYGRAGTRNLLTVLLEVQIWSHLMKVCLQILGGEKDK